MFSFHRPATLCSWLDAEVGRLLARPGAPAAPTLQGRMRLVPGLRESRGPAMKALSIRQPWANLIASGEKTIETRTWQTHYRGPLLIVSSRTPAKPPPSGHALAVATLVDCRPMTPRDERAAATELYPRAFSWVLTDVRRIVPVPVKGSLGMRARWQVPAKAM